MNEERHRSLIKQLVANARAIISYQVGLPLGVVRMHKILTWLEPFEVLAVTASNKSSNASGNSVFCNLTRPVKVASNRTAVR